MAATGSQQRQAAVNFDVSPKPKSCSRQTMGSSRQTMGGSLQTIGGSPQTMCGSCQTMGGSLQTIGGSRQGKSCSRQTMGGSPQTEKLLTSNKCASVGKLAVDVLPSLAPGPSCMVLVKLWEGKTVQDVVDTDLCCNLDKEKVKL